MVNKPAAGLLFLLLFTGCARSPVTPSTSNETEPPPIKSVDVVKATPHETTLTRGESGEVLVHIKIANGYHVNANPPSFPYLKATELEIPTADGFSVEFVTYPNPITKKFSFAETPLAVYEGETMVKATLKTAKSAKPGKHNISAKLRVQACDDKVCYAPGVLDVALPVDVK